jgi:hypothetical protein
VDETEPDKHKDPKDRERGEGNGDIETGHGGELLDSELLPIVPRRGLIVKAPAGTFLYQTPIRSQAATRPEKLIS